MQALPPGTKAQGGMIQGWQGVYDDAEQRRLLPAVRHQPARAVQGEVLPPERAPIYMPPDQPSAGSSFRTTYRDRSSGAFCSFHLPLATVAGWWR